jgi:hypothetical protein
MSANSNILRGKTMVLYILENDNNSNHAVNLAQKMPDVHIQNVRMLQTDKIPQWLDSVPTCISLGSKQIYKGGDALQYLSQRLQTMQQASSQQYMQQSGPKQQSGPSQQQQSGPSQQPKRSIPSEHPPQLPSHMRSQSKFQQGQENFTPQPSHPQGNNTQGYQQGPQGYPQNSQGPQGYSQNSQPPPQPPPNPHSSLQPASGSGQFGCSLDMAFQSFEPESTEDQPPTDDRYNSKSNSAVSQQDMQKYMQMREKTTSVRGAQQI